MIIEQVPDLTCDIKNDSEFAEKFLSFRNDLPADQRKVLNMLIGGAIATDDLNRGAHPLDEKLEDFSKALTTFGTSLPQAQRQGFTALLTAGALAWGQSSDPMPEQDQKPVALIWVHVARTAAVLIAGAITVIREATEDDEEVVVPCVTCNLPT